MPRNRTDKARDKELLELSKKVKKSRTEAEQLYESTLLKGMSTPTLSSPIHEEITEDSFDVTPIHTRNSIDYSEFLALKQELEYVKQQNKLLQQRIKDFEPMFKRVEDLEKQIKILEKTEKSDKADVFQQVLNSCSTQLLDSVSGIIDKKNQEFKVQLEKQLEQTLENFGKNTREIQKSIQETEYTQGLQEQIKEEVKEQQSRIANAKKIRIGGFSRDWWHGKDTKTSLHTEIQQLIPSLEWNKESIDVVTQVGNQLMVTFNTKADRLDILRQTSKLKGTGIWIVEELTRKQLEQKPAELLKVKKARAEGKWAVYRDGCALIRDFRSVNSSILS